MKKKFTFFLASMLFGVMVFAQQPVVTTLWDHSLAGTADWSQGFPDGGEIPEWMGNVTERGMALHNDTLYIVSRNFNPARILLLEAETGMLVDSIVIDTTAIEGGALLVNDIAITPSGKILLANLTASPDTIPFKVYMLEEGEDGEYETTTLLEWTQEFDETDEADTLVYRLGDGFAVFGDIGEGEPGYILTGDANANAVQPIVLKFTIEEDTINSEPEVIVLQEVFPAPMDDNAPRLGISPRFFPIDEDLFWADGHSTHPALYNMEGEMISTFNGDFHPIQTGVSGLAFFTFQDQDYIITPATNHVPPADTPAALFQLFSIPEEGAEMADSIAVFPEHGMGGNSNTAYSSSFAVDVQEDSALIYVLSPYNGVAAFVLSMEQDTSVVAEGRWNFSHEDFTELDSIAVDTTVNDLTIMADSAYWVTINEDAQSFNDVDYTHSLRLDTVALFDDDDETLLGGVLSFDVTPNSVITIIAKGAGEGEDESQLHIGVERADSILTSFTLTNEINSYEYVYPDDSTTLFIHASEFGADIYVIDVDTVSTSAPTIVDRAKVNIYPNPARDRVFITVKEPTQVAVYNLAGRLVKSKLIQSENDYMEVNDLQPGMYLIRSQFTNDFVEKLIVR